jgi:hypothetical protein
MLSASRLSDWVARIAALGCRICLTPLLDKSVFTSLVFARHGTDPLHSINLAVMDVLSRLLPIPIFKDRHVRTIEFTASGQTCCSRHQHLLSEGPDKRKSKDLRDPDKWMRNSETGYTLEVRELFTQARSTAASRS